jgi:hypothetical protein
MEAFSVPSTDIGYSAPIDMSEYKGLGATVSWTGTPTSVLSVQVGNEEECGQDEEKTGAPAAADVGVWDDDATIAAPNEPSADNASTTFNLSDIQSRWVRFKIDGTTNTGEYKITFTAKN